LETEPTNIESREQTHDIDYLIEHKVGLLPEPDEHEHMVDVENPDIKAKIEAAKGLFADFLRDYGEKFDLSDEASIDEVLTAAEQKGIYDQAKKIRELIYDKNISIYGVNYLSNVCNSKCTYCPMGVMSEEKFKLEEILAENPMLTAEERREMEEKIASFNAMLKTMSHEEARQDFDALAEIGHKEICVLSGEAITARITDLIDYVQLALDTPGIKEVILNMGAFDEKRFKIIKDQL